MACPEVYSNASYAPVPCGASSKRFETKGIQRTMSEREVGEPNCATKAGKRMKRIHISNLLQGASQSHPALLALPPSMPVMRDDNGRRVTCLTRSHSACILLAQPDAYTSFFSPSTTANLCPSWSVLLFSDFVLCTNEQVCVHSRSCNTTVAPL